MKRTNRSLNIIYFNTSEKAALDFKHNKREAEAVRVYEKIKDGIWSFNGVFKLMDSYQKQVSGREDNFSFSQLPAIYFSSFLCTPFYPF